MHIYFSSKLKINTAKILFRQQNERADQNKSLVKSLYDFAKVNENLEMCKLNKNGAVSIDVPFELVVDHMDEEQIWQQLELQVELNCIFSISFQTCHSNVFCLFRIMRCGMCALEAHQNCCQLMKTGFN